MAQLAYIKENSIYDSGDEVGQQLAVAPTIK